MRHKGIEIRDNMNPNLPILTNMLQAYWIDYEVWFWETSAWKYRDWVERYVVIQPLTNHADAPDRHTEGHGNHPTPTDRDVITIQPSVEVEDPDTDDESAT